MPTDARHVWVSGRVQGVAFRWFTRERAQELGLAGWVRNLADGRVEAWVEGPADRVESFVSWAHDGPPAARVTRVDAHRSEPRGFAGFAVEPSARS